MTAVAAGGFEESMNMKLTHHMYRGTAALGAARHASAPLGAARRAGRGCEPQSLRTLSGLAPWGVVGLDGRPVRARLNQQFFDSQI